MGVTIQKVCRAHECRNTEDIDSSGYCEPCIEPVSAVDPAGDAEWFHVGDCTIGADWAGPQCPACGHWTYTVVRLDDAPRTTTGGRMRAVECDDCGDRSPICTRPAHRVVF